MEKIIDNIPYELKNYNNIYIYTAKSDNRLDTVVKASIINDKLNKYKFKKDINEISFGFVTELTSISLDNSNITHVTTCFSNDIDALNFKNLLESGSYLQLSKDHEVYILKKTVPFYLINVNYLYNERSLFISLNHFGEFHKWKLVINDSYVKIIEGFNKTDIKIHLSSTFKLHIFIYDRYMDLLKEKFLYIDPFTSTESNVDSIYDENSLVVSMLDNVFYIDGIQQPNLKLEKNKVYLFDQNHSSNTSLFIYGSDKKPYINVNYYLNDEYVSIKRYRSHFHKKAFKYFRLKIITDELLYYDNSNKESVGGIITVT